MEISYQLILDGFCLGEVLLLSLAHTVSGGLMLLLLLFKDLLRCLHLTLQLQLLLDQQLFGFLQVAQLLKEAILSAQSEESAYDRPSEELADLLDLLRLCF